MSLAGGIKKALEDATTEEDSSSLRDGDGGTLLGERLIDAGILN